MIATGLDPLAWWHAARDWLERTPHAGWWIAGIWLLSFFGSLALMRILIVRMPADWFCRHDRPLQRRHPALVIVLILARNLVGLLLLVAGLVMLVGPGQGVLVLLLAVGFLDFPGKRRLELALVKRPRVRAAIDWIRRRAGRAPIILPGDRSTT